MRSLGYWLDRWYAETGIAARRARLAEELSQVLDAPVRLEVSGGGGFDSVYYAVISGERRGVLRLINPFKRRPLTGRVPVGPNGLWWALAADRRLEREWYVYERLCPSALSPEPLWRTHDALLCSYFDGQSFAQEMAAHSDRFWGLVKTLFRGLRRVHDHGIVHIDAKVENVLTDASGQRTVFIDFDCTPPPQVDFAELKAYDYLKLTHTALRLVPQGDRRRHDAWVDLLDQCVEDESRHARLDLIRQRPRTTRRVTRNAELCQALRAVFPHL